MTNIIKKSSPLRRKYLAKRCQARNCTIAVLLADTDTENRLSSGLRSEALLWYYEQYGRSFWKDHNEQEKKE